MKQILTNKENLIILITGIVSGFFVLYPISDFDIFWHLAAGKKIITEGNFLYLDQFSFTGSDQKWFDVHWFFQVTVYIIEHFTNITTLLLFKAILFGISIALLCKSTGRGRFTLVTGLIILCVVYIFRYLVPMRPIIFTAVFISLFFFLLENYFKSNRKIYLVSLLPVQIAWVNSQGLFMIGLFIYIAYFSGELLNNFLAYRLPDFFRCSLQLNKRRIISLSFVFCLILCCTLINPYAQNAIFFSLRLFRNINPSLTNIYSVNVTENMPLIDLLYTDYTYFIYAFIGMISLLALSSIFSLRNLRFSFLFSSLIFMILAYMAQRNLILFGLAFIPHFCWNMKHISIPLNVNYKIVKCCVSILLCICVANFLIKQWQLLRKSPNEIAPFSFPVASTEYLKKNNVPGNMFNADIHGGYIIWQMYPQKKVFIDTRLTLRSRAFFAEYISILNNPAIFFPSLCNKFSITHVIVPLATTDLYFNLSKYLYNDPCWNLVYTDGSEALFIIDSLSGKQNLFLNDQHTVDSIFHSLKDRFGSNINLAEESIFHFGNLLIKTGNLVSAESILSETQSEECRLLLANIKLLKGESDSALSILETMILKSPGNIQAQTLIASIYMSMHKNEEVKKAIFSVLFRDPIKVLKMLKEISEEKKI